MPASVSALPVDGITQGDHVCAVFDGAAAQEELVGEFVAAGLDRHERVVYYAGDASPEGVLAMLQASGVATAEPVAQGQLSVVPLPDSYLDEPFDPSFRIAVLSAALDAALADGYSGLRATEEPWTTHELPPAGLLCKYEARLGRLCAERSMVALCQYDGRRSQAPLLDTVRNLHDHALRDAMVSPDGQLRLVPLADDDRGNSRLRVAGEADISSSPTFLEALAGGQRGDLHMDLSRLHFVDLSAVYALHDLSDALRASRRRLILHNPPATLERILELLKGSLPELERSAS